MRTKHGRSRARVALNDSRRHVTNQPEKHGRLTMKTDSSRNNDNDMDITIINIIITFVY